MNFRLFMLYFCFLVTSFFLTSSVSANGITSVDHETWLKSIHESRAKNDSEFKRSPAPPLAGTSRFEINEADTVYSSENDGNLEWSPEQKGQPTFSLIKTEDQWRWTGLEEDANLMREGKEIPSGFFLAYDDNLSVGRFTSYKDGNNV